ncbi:MAG: DNA primase, partial [Ketobacter sp.]
YDLLARAERFYRQQLKSAPEKQKAVNYLKGRGLTGEIAARYGLGFAPPGFDNLINGLSLDKEGLEQAVTAGLLVRREDNGRTYDKFRDRIQFPIRDHRGRTIGFGGRVLGDGKPKYLNSPETPVFHKGRELYGLWEWRQSRDRSDRLYVVEGYMDVIALAQHGVPNAVATLGTATSRDHIEKLFRHSDELIFCFDGDEAGRRAAWRALENALPTAKDGRQIKFLLLPEGEDPDTLVRKNGKDYFEGLLDECDTLSEYFFKHLREEVDTRTMDGRARLASLAKPHLEQLPAGVLQQLMLKRLGEITELDDIQLTPAPPEPLHQGPDYSDYPEIEGLQSDQPPPYHDYDSGHGPGQTDTGKPGKRQPIKRKALQKTKHRDELSLVDATIRMLLNAPRQAAALSLPDELQGLQLPRMATLLELFEFIKQKPDASTASILGHWQNREDGDTIFKLAAKEFLLPNDEQSPELSDAVRRLYLQKVEQDLDQIIADGVKDKNKFKELLHLQKELSK